MIQKKIRKYLESKGWKVYIGIESNNQFTPEIHAMKKGSLPIWLSITDENPTIHILQQKEMVKIQKCGQFAQVIKDLDYLKKYLVLIQKIQELR